jgi:hypothetical protein
VGSVWVWIAGERAVLACVLSWHGYEADGFVGFFGFLMYAVWFVFLVNPGFFRFHFCLVGDVRVQGRIRFVGLVWGGIRW